MKYECWRYSNRRSCCEKSCINHSSLMQGARSKARQLVEACQRARTPKASLRSMQRHNSFALRLLLWSEFRRQGNTQARVEVGVATVQAVSSDRSIPPSWPSGYLWSVCME